MKSSKISWEAAMGEPQVPTGSIYTIQGVTVQFPYPKAYASQIIMMDKIIQGLKTQKNCLLESPTGSGKTLALLCASLAWQKKETAAYEKELEKELMFLESSQELDSSSNLTESNMSLDQSNTSVELIDVDDDDFQCKKARNILPLKNSKPLVNQLCCTQPNCENENVTQLQHQDTQEFHFSKGIRKPPKIYYGSRTHQQITQIIRELRKTDYRNTNMTILGSRQHYCIHPTVKTSKFRNEECKELISTYLGCRYHAKATNGSVANSMVNDNALQCWDIEELVEFGNKMSACPYFLSHELLENADIVFCPYNYLIDASIRQAMELHLGGSVLIFDEAHNMEDSARSAASFTLNLEDIQETIKDCEAAAYAGFGTPQNQQLILMFSRFSLWLADEANKCNEWDYMEFYEQSKVWAGVDFVAKLIDLGWGPKQYSDLCQTLNFVSTSSNENSERGRDKKKLEHEYQPSTKVLCQGLLLILKYMYKNNLLYVDDYKVVLSKASGNRRNQYERKRRRSEEPETVVTLNFICLNPAVAFSDFASDVYNIVLTSGTLSPMNTFESELGVQFPINFATNHIIDASQVWVGILGYGLNGSSLNATFKNADTYAFQDSVGALVMDVCKKTPNGVLCFFPSYSLLDKITNRWKSTELWDKIHTMKAIFTEPKSTDKDEFINLLNTFCAACQSTEASTGGAIFLAVCRGKVSEGLDFADSTARAVITIGIPFPNIKSVEIDLKRQYNNKYHKSRNLLNGNQWYEIQAFRALNQALGRCIRHRDDWGALILIDERFVGNQKYVEGLSKWVRSKITTYRNSTLAMESLLSFMKFADEKFTSSRSNNDCKVVQPLVKKSLPSNNRLFSAGNSTPSSSTLSQTEQRKYECSQHALLQRDMNVIQHSQITLTVDSDTDDLDSSFECDGPANRFTSIREPIRQQPSITVNVNVNGLIVDPKNQSQVPETQKCFKGIRCGQCRSNWTTDFADLSTTKECPNVMQKFNNKLVSPCSCETDSFKELYFTSDVLPIGLESKSDGLCNAIWDEETKCCYQLLVCQICKSNAAIQFKSSNRSTAWIPNQLWFIRDSSRFCISSYFQQSLF